MPRKAIVYDEDEEIATTPSTLGRLFPRIDKICDAAFIKKVIGTTKKDSVIFINETEICKEFFKIKEGEIDRHNELVRQDIVAFFRTPAMQMSVSQFKSGIKQKKAEDTIMKEELKKQAIILEYLREQEEKKRLAEERAKNGLPPNPDDQINEIINNAADKSKKIIKKTQAPVVQPQEDTQPNDIDSNHTTSITETIHTQSINNSLYNTNDPYNPPNNDQTSINESSIQEEKELSLNDVKDILEAVCEQGLIVFKVGDNLINLKSMEIDTNKLVIQLQPPVAKSTVIAKPTITIKK